ncbi:MAG: AsmA family protein, partial [Desulfobacterales bacterium]
SESKPPVAQPKTGRVFSDTPLQLEALNSLDLQAEIDIQELLLPHIALQNVKTTLQIDGGRFEAGPAQAVAGGGNYQAHFSFDARAKPPRMKAELKIDQMNVGMMLKELGRQEVLEGVMDFQADLSAQGNSMADLMGSLNGYTRLVSGQGRIGQLFFGLFTRDVGNQMLKLFNPLEKQESMTPIECMVIRFDSKNGKAELSQMVWVTPETIVVGGGQIDFKTEKIDIGIEPTPKQGSVSLGVLTKPFRLGGTLASPGMNIDPTAAALTAGELVGGVLMGPAGIAVAFSRIQKDVGNPCLEAVKDAENGVVPEKKGFFQKMGDAVRSLGGD